MASGYYVGSGANSQPLQAPYTSQPHRPASNAPFSNYYTAYQASFIGGATYEQEFANLNAPAAPALPPPVPPSFSGNPPNSAQAAAQAAASATNDFYKGYEQAVVAHARAMQLQAAQDSLHGVSTANWSMPPPAPPQFGGGGAKTNNWAAKKRFKKPAADSQLYFCELCNLSCLGEAAHKAHLIGKQHQRKADIKSGKIQLDTSLPQFKCEACNVTCCSKETFATHLSGTKHSKAVATLQRMGRPVPESLFVEPLGDPLANLPVVKKIVGVQTTKFVGGVQLSITGNEEGAVEVLVQENEYRGFEPIGEEFLDPLAGGKKQQFWCKLCLCNIGDPAARDLHVRGKRHRVSYRDKIDPTLNVNDEALVVQRGGLKPNPNNAPPPKIMKHRIPSTGIFYNPPKFDQPGAAPATPPAPPPLAVGQSFAQKIRQPAPIRPPPTGMSVRPETKKYDAYDEHHVQQRLSQLKPDAQQAERVESLVFLVERTLKRLSEMHVDAEKPDEDTRQLRGVVRVGALADGLLCRFDKRADLVLTCKTIPTITLLQEIVANFAAYVDDDEQKASLKLEMNAEESAFSVQFNDSDFVCHVTLTSVTMRVVETESLEKPAKPTPPPDALPESPCLRALADLRHTKFYQSKCSGLQSLDEVVILLRDIANRIEMWGVLPLYTMELIAHKTIMSVPVKLRVSDAFRRVFELLATGVLMLRGAKFEDPCEKEKSNPLSSLTPQQRENLVCSAQHGLRLMAYDQIHVVIGMERQTHIPKRPSTDTMAAPEAKIPRLGEPVPLWTLC
ncbi:DZF domain containing protein [Aphelenchoides fujianensis]|nr:DZF domain containing protein [Aphelenchoides fujianensis]